MINIAQIREKVLSTGKKIGGGGGGRKATRKEKLLINYEAVHTHRCHEINEKEEEME